MAVNHNLFELKKFFTFPFRGQERLNRFIIGCALMVASSIVPLIPTIPAIGYIGQVMRNVIRGEEPDMPAWSDWGRLFVDGLKIIAIGFIYTLPGFIVMFGGYLFYMMTFIGTMASDSQGAPGIFFFLGLMALFASMFIGIPLSLICTIPLPIAISHAIAHDRFGAAFKIGEWWRILRQIKTEYFIGWVILFGLMGIVYTLFVLIYMTVILCLALPLIMGAVSFWLYLVAGPIFAAIYREGAGAQQLPLVPPAPSAPAISIPEPAAAEMIAVEAALESEQPPASVSSVVEAFAAELPNTPVTSTRDDLPLVPPLPAERPAEDSGIESSLEEPPLPEADNPGATRRLPPDEP